MKRFFQKAVFFIIFFTLITNPFSITADYPSGSLVFSDDITPGNSFTWIIDNLDINGDRYETSTDFYVGSVSLNEGDETI